MEYNYPKFTPEMKKTHTILIPNMAITQFRLLEYALRYDGYKCEILGNCGSAVAQLGLKYVHNDTCYPALLVIGQFLDALNSGKIAGAGLDAIETEPIAMDNPLLSAKNCVITPHISWAALECRRRLQQTAIENVRAYLAGVCINVVC